MGKTHLNQPTNQHTLIVTKQTKNSDDNHVLYTNKQTNKITLEHEQINRHTYTQTHTHTNYRGNI